MKTPLYPLFADLTGRKVVVVGGGTVAQRKVESLLACKAEIRLISPSPTDQLRQWGNEGRIMLVERAYEAGDLDGAWLVIAATDDSGVNRAVFEQARFQRIFCNVVDQPQLCSFQVPAVFSRGDLQIAVSTGGGSPMLAVRICKQLSEQFDSSWGAFLDALQELRHHLKTKYPDNPSLRASILEECIESDARILLKEGKPDQFEQLIMKFKER